MIGLFFYIYKFYLKECYSSIYIIDQLLYFHEKYRVKRGNNFCFHFWHLFQMASTPMPTSLKLKIICKKCGKISRGQPDYSSQSLLYVPPFL